MNKQRRQELYDVVDFLDDAIDRLEDIAGEEEEAYDSLPAGLQYSKTGDSMQTAIDRINGFVKDIGVVKTNIINMIKNRR